MAKQKNKSNTPKFLLDLPYIKDIRASWIANQSHCDPNSPCRREHYIEKGIKFCPEWLKDIGFLRYYIWIMEHVAGEYIPGESKLQRIDQNKGFSPENCLVYTPESKNNNSPKKSRMPKAVTTGTHPTEVINNNIIIVDGNVDIAALMRSLNINPKRVLGELN